jgi:hypothetical protein
LNLSSQINYEQHINGRNHRKKVENLNKTNNPPAHLPISNTIQGINQGEVNQDKIINSYNCDICQTCMSGKDQLAAHLIGKKHLKKLSSLNSSNFVNSIPTTSKNTIDPYNLVNNNLNNDSYIDTNNLDVNQASKNQIDGKILI